jgi:membrane-bound serine protease (ClpP class)
MRTLFSLFIALYISTPSNAALAAHVEWLAVDGAIGPVADKMIGDAIDRAEATSAEALIIELDTPGGLLNTTREICKRMLAANVPIVLYISPSGARAGSAGVFLTLAAHIAVMAPGTNIGAAHPVGLGGFGGQDTSGTMKDKVTNDAAAFARTLAERHGRNIDWAERSVTQSVSATESEALQLNVVDAIISTRDSLLTFLQGRVVKLQSGAGDTLNTAGAEIRTVEKTLRLRILDFIADPNIAYILLMLGVYGLFFELYNPGAVLPGVVGGLALVLALFSLQLLPFNWAGLLLIGLGILFFALEIKITSYGLLTVSGLISMILGSFMLFDPSASGIRIPWSMILPASLLTALFFVVVVGLGLRAQRRKVTTGREGLVGEIGTVSRVEVGQTKIQIHGELWTVDSRPDLTQGARVRVTAVKGMTLSVEPLARELS